MLLPDKPQVAFLLERYRAWERLMLANPSNGTVRGRFEDTAYTLCVLMGRLQRQGGGTRRRALPRNAQVPLYGLRSARVVCGCPRRRPPGR